MKETEVPMTDKAIEQMLLEGERRPRTAGLSYVNWQNDFPCLADFLSEAWIDGGRENFITAARSVAREIAAETLERKGYDADPSPAEITATLVETMFTPADNAGSRSNFIRGALAEIHYEITLKENDHTVMDSETACLVLESNDEYDDVWTTAKLEKEKIDIVSRDPNGNVETHQIKATVNKPTRGKNAEYDNLVWYRHKNNELKDPRTV